MGLIKKVLKRLGEVLDRLADILIGRNRPVPQPVPIPVRNSIPNSVRNRQ